MANKNYSKTMALSVDAADAYQALTTGFENWWTKPDGNFHKVGDRAKVTFPPNESYWVFEAVKLTPDSVVELECVEAFHIILDAPTASKEEWLGSKLVWTIEEQDNVTHVHFVHQGLVPELACYNVCEDGWDHFFVESYKSYLETGTGMAHSQS